MPRRGSLLKKFLWEALNVNKYTNLFWVNEVEKSFALNCTHKNSKGWNSKDNQIYEDWVNVKTKNLSKRKSSDPRQRLRAALNNKKSKFIKFIKQASTYKIYQILEDCDIPSTGSDNICEYDSAGSPGSYSSLSECDSAGSPGSDAIENLPLTSSVMEDLFPPDPKVFEGQFGKNDIFFDEMDISNDNLQSDMLMDDSDFKELCKEIGINNATDLDFQNGIASGQLPVEVDIVPDQIKFGKDRESESQPGYMVSPQLNIDLTLTNFTQVGDHVVMVGKINH